MALPEVDKVFTPIGASGDQVGGGRGVGGAIQVQIQGDDQPEMVVNIDRDRATDLGLMAAQVAGALRTGLAGSTVGTYRPEGTRGWDVEVILESEDRARVERHHRQRSFTVIGGLLTSTLRTLLVIPSAYTLVDDAHAA